MSWIAALDLAIADQMQSKANVVLFLEDDAKPFVESEKPFQETMSDLLTERWPPDARIVLLGGHHIATYDGIQPNHADGATRITHAWGTYGWAIRKDYMPTLRDHWNQYVNQDRDYYACDESWHELWGDVPAYIATPLLVDHAPGESASISNTWADEADKAKAEKILSEYADFEGRSDWWNLERWDGSAASSKVHMLMMPFTSSEGVPAPSMALITAAAEQQATCELAMAECRKSNACSAAPERCECLQCSSSSDITQCYNCNIGNIGEENVAKQKEEKERWERRKEVDANAPPIKMVSNEDAELKLAPKMTAAVPPQGDPEDEIGLTWKEPLVTPGLNAFKPVPAQVGSILLQGDRGEQFPEENIY